jgi:hypothetical protein
MGGLALTVAVRWPPWLPASCGTWMARSVRMTVAQRWQRWSAARAMVRPDQGDTCLVGKSPQAARQLSELSSEDAQGGSLAS